MNKDIGTYICIIHRIFVALKLLGFSVESQYSKTISTRALKSFSFAFCLPHLFPCWLYTFSPLLCSCSFSQPLYFRFSIYTSNHASQPYHKIYYTSSILRTTNIYVQYVSNKKKNVIRIGEEWCGGCKVSCIIQNTLFSVVKPVLISRFAYTTQRAPATMVCTQTD